MKKEIFYSVFIFLLLLLNFGVLGYLWIDRSHGHSPGPESIDPMIVERLKLDESQRDQFDQLKHEHHAQMIKIDEESGNLHRQLFEILKKEPVDTVGKNVIVLKLQNNDRQKELVTFEHFKKLRAILRPDQKPLFDDFVEELSRHLMGPPPDQRRGPGE